MPKTILESHRVIEVLVPRELGKAERDRLKDSCSRISVQDYKTIVVFRDSLYSQSAAMAIVRGALDEEQS